ncbi:MAG: hypothetical protein R2857_11670 [Vampirovibrionales bacterium]
MENPYKPVGAQKIGAGANNPLDALDWLSPWTCCEYGDDSTDTFEAWASAARTGVVRMQIKDAETLFDMVEVVPRLRFTHDLIDLRKNGEQVVGTSYADAMAGAARLQNWLRP